jgi:dipeptidyl aminopeptidase/acylaminoacyl peptidase
LGIRPFEGGKTARIHSVLAVLAAVFLPGLLCAQEAPRPFTPEDMLGIVEFVPGSFPAISPDGAWVAYATVDPTLESNILARHPDGFLWVVKPGGKPVRIDDDDYADTPIWSPDGGELAFFRTRQGRRQLCIWTAATGAMRELGESFPKDEGQWGSELLAPQWTASGTAIVYAVLLPAPQQPDPESQLVHSTDLAMPGDAPFIDARKWTLVSVEVRSGHAHPLNPRPISLTRFAVSPNGSQVLFRAITPETLALFRHERSQDWLAPADGSQPPHAILEGHPPAWIAFSFDGRDLLFSEKGKLRSMSVASGDEKIILENFPERTCDPRVTANGWLAVLAARPGTGPRDSKMYSILEPTWDVVVAQIGQANLRTLTESEKETQSSDLVWSGDGRTLFYRSVDEQSYRESIHRWQTGNEASAVIYSADQALRSLLTSRDGSAVSFAASSATAPEEGYLLEASQPQPRRITNLNPQLAAFAFQPPRVFHFTSADGDPLEGLLFLPAKTDSSHRVPVVTYTYEKLSPSKNRFNAEAQWYISHGYGYLMPDVLIKDGLTGDSFVNSVIPAVNAVRAMDFTTGRFGITGGSFGGYSGLFLISHSDIFAAAVLRAPPSDFFSTWGDGRDRDVWTIETGQARTTGTPWTNRDGYLENSPFFVADRVHTPVLIVHGKADFTVPFQQGLMMFAALRALHRTSDLLIYRDAEHSIVRGSRFRFLDFHQHTMEWWDRYLRGDASAKPKAESQ